MLTPEQVSQMRHELATFERLSKANCEALLRDRAEIAQELEEALSRKAEPNYSMTKALTALIERIK